MTELTFFAHGTTTDNEAGLATGWNGGELSELGKRQSEDLEKAIAEKFDLVFCSDLKRAIDSAEIAFGKKYQVIPDRRLREVNYGNLTGTEFSAFSEKLADFIDAKFPGGESYKDVEKRVSEFLGVLKTNYPGKKIAIVSHQGPQLALEVLINKKSWKEALSEDWRRKKDWKPGWKYVLSD
ncbi:MAG: histidine phosphatase family protein [Candidatus Aenigmarchaeota archaeon]|nr:histidine phosphatase family protein [Candidatus Aenigmarchaeota archaeon]